MTSNPASQPHHSSVPIPEPATPDTDAKPKLSSADWLKRFWPSPLPIDRRERWRMVVGIVLGVGVVAICAQVWGLLHPPGLWMVASLAASAVLIMGLPSSPLAQPWAVLGGSMLSATIGVLIAHCVPPLVVAAALAVGLAVTAMLLLRCLHPPGASLALLAVLEPTTHTGRYLSFVLFDVLLLIFIGIVYNRLTGRAYPHQKLEETMAKPVAGRKARPFTTADLDAALKSYNGVLDISRNDLENLLEHAALAAFQRTLGDLRCKDIMSSPAYAIGENATLSDGWLRMRTHAVKALPVVDEHQSVIGIITTTDLLQNQFASESNQGIGRKLRALIPWGGPKEAPRIGALMSSPVQVAGAEQHVMDLVPMFSAKGRRHVPIVNEEHQLIGIISQTDVIKTLANALTP